MFVVTLLWCIIADYTSKAQVVTIKPISVTALENDKVTFTCIATVQEDWRSTKFDNTFDFNTMVTFINNGGSCYYSSNTDRARYIGRCGTLKGQFILEILKIDDQFNNQTVKCIAKYGPGTGSDINIERTSYISILIPITVIGIFPTGDRHVVSVIQGHDMTFTGTTDSGRPAAWIQWYIDGKNVTDKASSIVLRETTKFISKSTLVYTGDKVDHNKVIYCKALNIEGRKPIKSTEKVLFIILPVTNMSIAPVGNNDVVSLESGSDITFTCTTGPGRPAALIRWYIGGHDMTDQATSLQSPDITDNTTFISTSTLVYRGKDADHDKAIHCEAVNTEGGNNIKTRNKTLYIIVPVTSLTLSPIDKNNRSSVISSKQQQYVCRTNLIRPAARIQWYIGGQNVTSQASSTEQNDRDSTKLTSTSTLVYTGNTNDHNKVVYCEAVNIKGRQKTKSTETYLFIILPVTTLIIDPVGNKDVVSVVSGTNITFTCTTGPGRPTAWIQWYISGQNVTDQATASQSPDITDNTTFISSSKLVYLGKDADHDKVIYCETVNTEEGEKIKTENKTLYIIVPVPKVTFEPNGGSDEVRVVKEESQTFTCRTEPGRPAAWIHWFIGGTNVTNKASSKQQQSNIDPTKFISISELVYTGRNIDHNKSVNCEAGNTKSGQKVETDDITLFIIIFITDITMTTDKGQSVVNVESDKTHTFTCRTDSGRPAANIQWYIGGHNVTNHAFLLTEHDRSDKTMFISTSTLDYTGNDSDHSKAINCEAGTTEKGEKIKTENKTLYIIVPIKNVTLTPQDVESSITVNSGESKNFTCKTGSSRPAAWIQWYIKGQNVTNQASQETQSNGTQYISSSYLPYIGNIQDHNQYISCNAFNIYGGGSNISDKELIDIRSSPTSEKNETLPGKVFVGTNERLNLTVTVIANPSPNVTWTYTNGTTPSYVISWADFNMTSLDTFRHVIVYQIEQPRQTDFGNYTIEVINDIRPSFVHTFVVEPAQAPSKPFSLDAECDPLTPRINVSWKSNFDGGKPQKFSSFLFNVFTNDIVKSQYIPDKGQNAIHFFHSQKLDYNSNYIIFVQARNKYGRANSSELVNCTTSSKISLNQESSLAVIGVAAGSTAAVIAIVIVAILLILRRRTRKKGDKNQYLNGLKESETKQDEGDEDGIRDNPLYGTSRISTKADVYSQIKKTPKKMKESTVKSSTNIKKSRHQKGNQKIGTELDVYENSEDFRNDFDKNIYGNMSDQSASPVICSSSGYQLKKNKDGLIYADLEFAQAESGKKFFIIGSENRTNYAMIDLTMKAAPLPYDSDEDAKKDLE